MNYERCSYIRIPKERGGIQIPMHNPTMRVISAFNLISAHEQGLSLASCSKLSGIPAGTLYPILQTLYKKNYLDYDTLSCRYTVGMRLFLAGLGYVSGSQPYDSLQKILQSIAAECGETAHFGVLEAGKVLYLAKADSSEAVRMYSAVGRSLPAYATALGKALLSGVSRDQLTALYPDGLKPLTEHTITDMDKLYRQLCDVRSTGFAYESEESNNSICCIAVPVMLHKKNAASLSVAVPVFRYTEEKKRCIERCLKAAALSAGKILPYLHL